MYNVLILDDEQMVTEGLSQLIKSSDPDWNIVGTYNDANDVLKEIVDIHVDLIITDIRMPGMDGLSFIKCIRERNKDVQIIILSGYGYFEYAKKAIHYDVTDFLLKPLVEDELFHTLDTIKKKIQHEKNQCKEMEKYKARRDILNGIIKKTYNPKVEKLDDFQGGLHYRCLMIEQVADEKPLDVSSTNQSLKDIIVEYLKLNNISFDVLDSSAYKLHFLLRSEAIICLEDDEISKLMLSMSKHLPNGQENITIGISDICEGLIALSDIYSQSLRALKQNWYDTDGYIFFYSQLHNRPNKALKRLNILQHIDKIIDNVKLGDFIQVHKFVSEIFQCFVKEHTDFFIVKNYITLIITNINGLIQSKNRGYSFNEVGGFTEGEMEGFYSIESLETMFLEFLQGVTLQCKEENAYRMEKKISDAMDYIKANYNRDISLDEVSQISNLNSSYFSKKFKEEVGQSYIEFVTELRLDRSKELLANTNDSINTIAAQVGYIDTKYFMKLFKKNLGLTPASYRKIIKNSHLI